jgi:branched-chain amino acid transport system ATP-binding protein
MFNRTERSREIYNTSFYLWFTNIFDGKIELEGNEITKLTPAEKLSKVGIAYILQDNSVFPDMTVEENLLMGGLYKR